MQSFPAEAKFEHVSEVTKMIKSLSPNFPCLPSLTSKPIDTPDLIETNSGTIDQQFLFCPPVPLPSTSRAAPFTADLNKPFEILFTHLTYLKRCKSGTIGQMVHWNRSIGKPTAKPFRHRQLDALTSSNYAMISFPRAM
jgi:hypothetical protein